MSKYIDAHAYEADCDWDVCFRYLYHIFRMLAYKQKMFKTSKEYEDFGLYAATRMTIRYIKPQRKSSQKIKSILNYAKAILYGLSVNFRRMSYQERLISESVGDEGVQNIKDMLAENVLQN